jgi:hypothetical protein
MLTPLLAARERDHQADRDRDGPERLPSTHFDPS